MKSGSFHKNAFSVLLAFLFVLPLFAFPLPVSAKSTPLLTLEAEDGKLGGNASKSGFKVGNIGKNGGSVEGTVTFKPLEVPSDGDYLLKVFYCSGSDDRYFNIKTDYGSYKLNCPSTGGFDKVGSIEIEVELRSGGSLRFGSDWYGPDLDKVEIYSAAQTETPGREYGDPDYFEWEERMKIDRKNGVFTLTVGGREVLKNARAEVVINGDIISSDEFSVHAVTEDKGNKTLTVTHTGHPSFKGSLTQIFYTPDENGIQTMLTVNAPDGQTVTTNNMTPAAIYGGGADIENGVFLQIPFDNDMWVEPSFIPVNGGGKTLEGYEVCAYYDQNTGAGLVIGSLSHDTWKSAIRLETGRGKLAGLRIYAGASDSMTRDNSPHGSVSGSSVCSPAVFIGYYPDWRQGMTAYGKACASVTPPKQSVENVPFGYNSWGSLQASVKYSDMITTSDFIKDKLQSAWSEDGGAVYINIDSFWDFITYNDPGCGMGLDQALRSFVLHCKQNGQKAGVYFTPFACWHGSESELKNSRVDGTKYSYYDAVIKKSDGSGVYGKLDGGYPLDPTHPATVYRFEQQLKKFIKLGFEYVKLDFMTHGALEGQHYDPQITTGIQAYNYGMNKILEICDGKMFVNLSIAPLFPYQYADGRRISCDAFSSLDNTMHVLSFLTACFWEEEIYPYPDPDHLVVLGSAEGVARCRVTAGAICGTSFLVGDDLTNIKEGSAAEKRILKMFANPGIISVAKLGRAFTPYDVLPGERCADAYYCEDNGYLYIAVFNFGERKSEKSFDLSKITSRVSSGAEYTELWSDAVGTLESPILNVSVKGQDVVLFKITEDPESEPEVPANGAKISKTHTVPIIVASSLAALGVVGAGASFAILRKKKKNKG